MSVLEFLLDNIFERFGETVYHKFIEIPMGTNCTQLNADLFLYCNESYFMARINKDPSKQHLAEECKNTFRNFEDILAPNMCNDDFNIYTKDIYPLELSLNKANIDDKNIRFLIIILIWIMLNLILKFSIKGRIVHSLL